MIAETCGVCVGQGDGPKQSTEELIQLSDALEEADALRVAASSRDAALRAQVRVPWLRETPALCNSCRALRKQRIAGFLSRDIGCYHIQGQTRVMMSSNVYIYFRSGARLSRQKL